MIGSTLDDRYEIVDELGRGGMGIVYLARDPLLEREVAIKLVPPSLLNNETEERLRREAKTVAKMDHHTIVPVHDMGTHDGSLYFVMPVVRGDDLRHVIPERTLKTGHILDIGIQVARALEYSHARGILHRDIKPSNIMISRESQERIRVRIMDFGLAKSDMDTRMTRSGDLVGTMSYLSPEQVSGKEVDARSDLYSLGCVLFECFCGEPPYRGDVHATLYRIVYEQTRRLSDTGVEVPREVDDLIARCMAKDASRRPSTARDLAEDIEKIRPSISGSGQDIVVLDGNRGAHRSRPSATPFVGRKDEFALLQDQLHTAVGGECQFVLVGGDVGVGKSRLLEHFEELVRAKQIVVLRGQFVDEDQRIPYYGFCDVIQDWFRRGEEVSSSTSAQDLEDLADELTSQFPVLAEIEPLFSLTSHHESGAREAHPPLAEDKDRIFELISRTITRIAGGQPLVLLLEDIHQAELSIEALQYLIRRLGPTPTMIVATCRLQGLEKGHALSKFVQRLEGDRHFTSIQLDSLDREAHEELVSTILGGSPLAEDLGTKLYEATEGNPFFTKEIVRSLMESQVILEDESKSWVLAGERDISSIELPGTIQQAVEKRIEGLSETSRNLLVMASVLGRSFDYRDLEALAGGGEQDHLDVEDTVDALVRDGVLTEVRSAREDLLAFESGIVRDVLYSTLTRRRRRSLHLRAAETLESRSSGQLPRLYHRLLDHFTEADVPEKVIEFGMLAAKNSLESYDPQEAIRAVRTALDFIDDERWDRDPLLEAEGSILLAQANRMLGHIETALKSAESAVRILETEGTDDHVLEAILLAAETAWEGRRIREATEWTKRGASVAARGGKKETRRRLFTLAATLANLRGDYESARLYMDQRQELEGERPERIVPTGGNFVTSLAHPVSTPLDPATALTMEAEEILANVVETLFSTDTRGNLAPLICSEWEVEDGGLSVRIQLDERVRFSNGDQLTAQDVKDSLTRSINNPLGVALSIIKGSPVEGETSGDVEGIVILAPHELRIELKEPFPIFPTLLSDTSAAICRVDENDNVLGTGPFTLGRVAPEKVTLVRNTNYWKSTLPALDSIEFRLGLESAVVVEGIRTNEIDLARDLAQEDVDLVTRDSRFRGNVVEAARKNLYFLVFNEQGPLAARPELREALSRVLDTRDIVWSTLGRYAEPATGLYPPGILGHDPARRHKAPISEEEARSLIEKAGLTGRIKLRAAVHPVFRERFAPILESMLGTWEKLGVKVSIATNSMASFLRCFEENKNLDFMLIRWNPDYEDADNFSWGFFHSRDGRFKRYFSSPETDEIARQARANAQPEKRLQLYHRFEKIIVQKNMVVPLFSDLDFRVVSPRVTNLRLQTAAPFVNYTGVGKLDLGVQSTPVRRDSDPLAIPMAGRLDQLDPARSRTVTGSETLPLVFESLTRMSEGCRVVPWLAAEWEANEDSSEFRFKLRPDVHFHDGRRLTSRDVRASFERFLKVEGASHYVLSSIRGALDVIRGKASELEGLKLLSSKEFTLKLEEPVAILPLLLSHVTTSILSESSISSKNQEGQLVGTGPFKAVHFEPNERLELEAHGDYWRSDLPRSEGLVFSLRVPRNDILSEFKSGRFALAGELEPADVESLRYGSSFAAGYRECPGLSTGFVMLNTKSGPLSDVDLRRSLIRLVDVPDLVENSFGRLAVPADGLIPPGLVGYERRERPKVLRDVDDTTRCRSSMKAAIMPTPGGDYARIASRLFDCFAAQGIEVEITSSSHGDFFAALQSGEVDIVVGRWNADYPDPDSFFHGLFDSTTGVVRQFHSSPEIDEAIRQGRAESDPEVRHMLYRDLNRKLLRDAAILPLLHEQNYRFARPEIEGLKVRFSQPVVPYEDLKIRT